MNSFFFFSSKLIVNRIFFLKKLLLLLLLLLLFFLVHIFHFKRIIFHGAVYYDVQCRLVPTFECFEWMKIFTIPMKAAQE